MINNEIYHELGEKWYNSEDNPVALLRAEAQLKNPWVIEAIHSNIPAKSCKILDIGCGAGFLTNALAQAGHQVLGIDLSESSLQIAKIYDKTQTVQYQAMNAEKLMFPSLSFDVVCAMDFLEHVENPEGVIAEASRVLRPGGFFFFHTFNRNFLSWLVIIKGVEWFVKNTPKNLHVQNLFIKPKELQGFMKKNALQLMDIRGIIPDPFTFSFWKMIFFGRVDSRFQFCFSRSLLTGYCGIAQKVGLPQLNPASPTQ